MQERIEGGLGLGAYILKLRAEGWTDPHLEKFLGFVRLNEPWFAREMAIRSGGAGIRQRTYVDRLEGVAPIESYFGLRINPRDLKLSPEQLAISILSWRA